jgi:glycerate-2-kinase
MPIFEVNTVRKQVSAFKGGRFAAAAAPARLINLTVSDVAGDRLDTLTDPSVDNASTVADAIAVLRDHDLWGEVPESVRTHLSDVAAELPDLSDAGIHTTLLVSGASVCEQMAATVLERGSTPVVLSTSLEGEATTLGADLAKLAADHPPPAVLLGCGGEASVRLGRDGRIGAGGPNGEAALAAAAVLEGTGVAIAFLDTDGSDGGTALAGAVVDGTSAARARAASLDLAAALSAHRSGEMVRALGDGIETGPTHTNVNDLFVAAIAAPG